MLESIVKKISCVSGDMMEPGLGLSREDRQTLRDKVNIIINGAAIVAWNRTLDVYVQMHIGGIARYAVCPHTILKFKSPMRVHVKPTPQ